MLVALQGRWYIAGCVVRCPVFLLFLVVGVGMCKSDCVHVMLRLGIAGRNTVTCIPYILCMRLISLDLPDLTEGAWWYTDCMYVWKRPCSCRRFGSTVYIGRFTYMHGTGCIGVCSEPHGRSTICLTIHVCRRDADAHAID